MKNKVYYQGIGSTFLLIVTVLMYIVRFYPKTIAGFDSFFTKLIRSGMPTMDGFYLWMTKFANPASVILVAVVIVFFFVYHKRLPEAVWFGGGFALMAGIVNPVIKQIVQRARPTLPHMVTEHSYSFPSGHSLASMVLYGGLIFLLPTIIPDKRFRLPLQIVLGLIAFLVPISRVYLGVHFPSDVLAGSSLGLAWLLLSYPIFNEYKTKWYFKQGGNNK